MRGSCLQQTLLYVLLLFLLWPCLPLRAEESRVRDVAVILHSTHSPPAVQVEKRMIASIASVSEQILVGRTVDNVTRNSERIAQTIRDVFDRVLTGYSIDKVTIVPGLRTEVHVWLSPWGEVVEKVVLKIDAPGVSPEIRTILDGDLTGLTAEISQVLAGLPVDAFNWAEQVVKSIIREMLRGRLPEYQGYIELKPGPVTQVTLTLASTGPVVEDVQVVLRSQSIPNIILLAYRPQAETEARKLRGLPVKFVERHRALLEKTLYDHLVTNSVTQRYNLRLTVTYTPGEITELAIDAETPQTRLRLESYLDMGKPDSDLTVRLHTGRMVEENTELFLDTLFIPGTFDWQFTAGWGYRLASRTVIGLKRQLNEDATIAWVRYQFTPAAHFRWEQNLELHRYEAAVGYKVYDFMSLELVTIPSRTWLRLVGNL